LDLKVRPMLEINTPAVPVSDEDDLVSGMPVVAHVPDDASKNIVLLPEENGIALLTVTAFDAPQEEPVSELMEEDNVALMALFHSPQEVTSSESAGLEFQEKMPMDDFQPAEEMAVLTALEPDLELTENEPLEEFSGVEPTEAEVTEEMVAEDFQPPGYLASEITQETLIKKSQLQPESRKTVRSLILPPTTSFNSLSLTDWAGQTVSTVHAALSQKIGRGCHVKLPEVGSDVVFSIQLTTEIPEWTDPVILAGSFGKIEIAEGTRFVRTLCGIDLGETDGDNDVTAWLHASILGHLHATPFASANRLVRLPLTDIDDPFVVCLVVRSHHHVFTTCARASAAEWLDWLARTEWHSERQVPEENLHLPFDLPVRVARHILPASVFCTLDIGDIVLPSSSYFICNGDGFIQLGNLVAKVRYQAPSMLEIISVETKLNQEDYQNEMDARRIEELRQFQMQEEDDSEYDDDGDDDDDDDGEENAEDDEVNPYSEQAQTGDLSMLEQVPVTLDFELGHVRMSLGQLSMLGAGTILLLEDGSPASIAILSSGRIMGQGEAVDVNGQLGIRIVQWGQSS
jgi:type III secretion protein Q